MTARHATTAGYETSSDIPTPGEIPTPGGLTTTPTGIPHINRQTPAIPFVAILTPAAVELTTPVQLPTPDELTTPVELTSKTLPPIHLDTQTIELFEVNVPDLVTATEEESVHGNVSTGRQTTTTPQLIWATSRQTDKPHVVLAGLLPMRPPLLTPSPINAATDGGNTTDVGATFRKTPCGGDNGACGSGKSPRRVYGDVDFAMEAYRYAGPAILCILLLLTGGFTAALVLQARSGSRMNKASCLLLAGIALADMLTVAAAIAELVHLYAASAGNHDVLTFHSCHVMYVLERLSAIPHTASIWITVALSVQRYICVAKPFYANRIISMKSSSAIIGVTFLFAGITHVIRFIDGHFEPVNVTKSEYPNITIETCEFRYETWITSTNSYEEAFAWTRVIVIQLIPCILLVAFASMMIKSLYASSKRIIEEQIHVGSDKRKSDRRLLSVFVVTVSLIVSVVELAGGVIICIGAVAISKGTYIRHYTDLKITAIAMDILLYISYFCIFIIYCFMSRNFRTRMRNLWDAVHCNYHYIRHRHTSYSSPTQSTSGDSGSKKSKGYRKGSAKESRRLTPSASMETRTTIV